MEIGGFNVFATAVHSCMPRMKKKFFKAIYNSSQLKFGLIRYFSLECDSNGRYLVASRKVIPRIGTRMFSATARTGNIFFKRTISTIRIGSNLTRKTQIIFIKEHPLFFHTWVLLLLSFFSFSFYFIRLLSSILVKWSNKRKKFEIPLQQWKASKTFFYDEVSSGVLWNKQSPVCLLAL